MSASPSPKHLKRYSAAALAALLILAPALLVAGEADDSLQKGDSAPPSDNSIIDTICYARDSRLSYYFNFGSRFGGEGPEAYTDLIMPFFDNGPNLVFLNPRASIAEEGQNNLSLGLGLRRMVTPGLVIGGNLFTDSYETKSDNRLSQWGAGLEILSDWVDFRANFYDASSSKKKNGEYRTTETETASSTTARTTSRTTARTTSRTTAESSAITRTSATPLPDTYSDPYALDHSIYYDLFRGGTKITRTTTIDTTYTTTSRTTYTTTSRTNYRTETTRTTTNRLFERFEAGMDGWDAELGFRLPWNGPETRLFGGYYAYDNPWGDDVDGWKARLEVKPGPWLSLDAELYEDGRLHGSDWFVGARVSIPLSRDMTWKDFKEGLFSMRPRCLNERMRGEMTRRDGTVHKADSPWGENAARRQVEKRVEVDTRAVTRTRTRTETSTSTRKETRTETSETVEGAGRTEQVLLAKNITFVDGAYDEKDGASDGRAATPFNDLQKAADNARDTGNKTVFVYEPGGRDVRADGKVFVKNVQNAPAYEQTVEVHPDLTLTSTVAFTEARYPGTATSYQTVNLPRIVSRSESMDMEAMTQMFSGGGEGGGMEDMMKMFGGGSATVTLREKATLKRMAVELVKDDSGSSSGDSGGFDMSSMFGGGVAVKVEPTEDSTNADNVLIRDSVIKGGVSASIGTGMDMSAMANMMGNMGGGGGNGNGGSPNMDDLMNMFGGGESRTMGSLTIENTTISGGGGGMMGGLMGGGGGGVVSVSVNNGGMGDLAIRNSTIEIAESEGGDDSGIGALLGAGGSALSISIGGGMMSGMGGMFGGDDKGSRSMGDITIEGSTIRGGGGGMMGGLMGGGGGIVSVSVSDGSMGDLVIRNSTIEIAESEGGDDSGIGALLGGGGSALSVSIGGGGGMGGMFGGGSGGDNRMGDIIIEGSTIRGGSGGMMGGLMGGGGGGVVSVSVSGGSMGDLAIRNSTIEIAESEGGDAGGIGALLGGGGIGLSVSIGGGGGMGGMMGGGGDGDSSMGNITIEDSAVSGGVSISMGDNSSGGMMGGGNGNGGGDDNDGGGNRMGDIAINDSAISGGGGGGMFGGMMGGGGGGVVSVSIGDGSMGDFAISNSRIEVKKSDDAGGFSFGGTDDASVKTTISENGVMGGMTVTGAAGNITGDIVRDCSKGTCDGALTVDGAVIEKDGDGVETWRP